MKKNFHENCVKFREITFMTVLNFFLVQKLIFGHFLKLQKMEFGRKFFFMKLIYLISRVFLAWTFFNFLAHTVHHLEIGFFL